MSSIFLYYSEEIPQVDGADDSDEDSQNQQVCFIRNNNYVYYIKQQISSFLC